MNTATIVPAGEATSRDAPVLTDDGADTQPDPISLRVELVEDDDAFLRMGPVWNLLVDEARVDHPFLRYEWVRPGGMFQAGRQTAHSGRHGRRRADCHRPADVRPGRVYGCAVRRLRGNRQRLYGTVRSHFDPKGKRCL